MSDFTFGHALLDRAAATSGYVIQKDSVSPSNGIITGLGITMNSGGTLKILVLKPLDNNVSCIKQSLDCGTVTAGEHQFLGLSLAVQAGECLGFVTSGYVEGDTDAGALSLTSSTPTHTDVGDYVYAATATGKIYSLQAWADYSTLGASEQEIYDELDRMYSEDYQGAEDWLDANWDFEAGPLVLAEIARANLTAGTGGTGGGATIEDINTALDTRFGATAIDLAALIEDIRDEIGVKNGPATGLLAALETVNTNLDGDLVQARTDILQAISDIPANDNTAVLTAITTHDGYSNDRRDAILLAIAGVAAVVGTLQVGRTIMSVADAIKAVVDTIDGIVDTLPTSVPDYSTELADMDADLTNISNKIDALDIPAGTPSGYPGSALVTFGTPVAFNGPTEVNVTMDGCLIEFDTMPAGTGKYEVNGHVNWQHAGWIAFLADSVYGDTVQFLGPEAAVYCPKGIATPSGCLLFPRAGSSGTITPWTRNA